jgi:alkanesulfonate monooxygenase
MSAFLLDAAEKERRLDKRPWTGIAPLTGAPGQFHWPLVGTPDRIADAMLDYYDIGITTFLVRGCESLVDAIKYGRELLPRVPALIDHARPAGRSRLNRNGPTARSDLGMFSRTLMAGR